MTPIEITQRDLDGLNCIAEEQNIDFDEVVTNAISMMLTVYFLLDAKQQVTIYSMLLDATISETKNIDLKIKK